MKSPRHEHSGCPNAADGQPENFHDAILSAKKGGLIRRLGLYSSLGCLLLFCFGWLAEAVWNRQGLHYHWTVLLAVFVAIACGGGLLLAFSAGFVGISGKKKFSVFISGILAGFVTIVGGYVSSDLKHDNLRVLVPAQAYRAGLMSTNALIGCIEKYGIKSILNLRGEGKSWEWYGREVETAKNLNVAHYDFGISARKELTDSELGKLEQILRDAPKPVLIHCDGGADRSALASAIYLYAISGEPAENARRELSPWNGHLPILWPKVSAMDDSFRRFVSNYRNQKPMSFVHR